MSSFFEEMFTDFGIRIPYRTWLNAGPDNSFILRKKKRFFSGTLNSVTILTPYIKLWMEGLIFSVSMSALLSTTSHLIVLRQKQQLWRPPSFVGQNLLSVPGWSSKLMQMSRQVCYSGPRKSSVELFRWSSVENQAMGQIMTTHIK